MSAALVVAIVMALAFAATNGLHDAANSIATLVMTRAARPGPAVVLAAMGNVVGPLLIGSAVANTIAGIVTVPNDEVVVVLGAALTGAVAWNTITWWRGLPSSSGHALLGGLVGAALVEGGTSAVNWGGFDGLQPVGVLGVIAVLAIAPVVGYAAGLVADRVARWLTRRATDRFRGPVRGGQWAMSGGLALSHGANDAQKVVGVVALLLLASGETSSLHAPTWVELACGTALTLGTVFGGWPIVRTIGARIVRLRPIDALASQTGSTAALLGATLTGAPVSTTQVVASSVVGVGVGKRRIRHVRWAVVRSMADRLVADGSRHRTAGDRGTLSLEVAGVSTRRWFLPENPHLLDMLGRQAGITMSGMEALVAWANGDVTAGDVVRAPRARSRHPQARTLALPARRVLASARRRRSVHVVSRARRGVEQREGSRSRDGPDESPTERTDA